MTQRLGLNDIINSLLENGIEDFHKTQEYRLLCEKHNSAVENYEFLLSQIEKDAVNQFLEVLMEIQSAEIEFIYKQGLKDSVQILKKLTVI